MESPNNDNAASVDDVVHRSAVLKCVSPCGQHYVRITKPEFGELRDRNIAIVEQVLECGQYASVAREFGLSTERVRQVVQRFCRSALRGSPHKSSEAFWTPLHRSKSEQKWIASNIGWLRIAFKMR